MINICTLRVLIAIIILCNGLNRNNLTHRILFIRTTLITILIGVLNLHLLCRISFKTTLIAQYLTTGCHLLLKYLQFLKIHLSLGYITAPGITLTIVLLLLICLICLVVVAVLILAPLTNRDFDFWTVILIRIVQIWRIYLDGLLALFLSAWVVWCRLLRCTATATIIINNLLIPCHVTGSLWLHLNFSEIRWFIEILADEMSWHAHLIAIVIFLLRCILKKLLVNSDLSQLVFVRVA